MLAHGVLLECDLLYGHADGKRTAHGDAEAWNDEDACFARCFHCAAIATSPNGFLPTYRFCACHPPASPGSYRTGAAANWGGAVA